MQVKHPEFEKLFARYPALAPLRQVLEEWVARLISLYERDGVLFLAGNGGSAADCEHICGELLKGFKSRRTLSHVAKQSFTDNFAEEGQILGDKLQEGLRAISLLSHPGLTSAFGNDVDPQCAFAQQLWALGRREDMFLGISTSGNAENVKLAMMAARVRGMSTVLLTGNKHGICERYADLVIPAPASETYVIQEYHLAIYHAVCIALEADLFN